MLKLLLTGSTGFIGSSILSEISKDCLVFITSRKKKKIIKNKNITDISFRNYDELNLKLKKIRVDVIIHCATQHVLYHTYEDLKKLADSNILFGNIILENIKKMGAKKIINFSTVAENHNGKKDNFLNLYAAYKKSFSILIKYYEKINPEVNFYNLVLSDTFGKLDKRKKIINVMRQNYRDNKITTIISKNLYLNLLNIVDLISAIKLILKRKVKTGTYLLKNKKNINIHHLIKEFNKKLKKKIKIRWLSTKTIRYGVYDFKKLKYWEPKHSNIQNIIELIKP
jgi:nucleoside-diphosphate-sugar epimerase